MALCNLVVVFLRIMSSYPPFQDGVGAWSKWRWLSSSHGLDGTINCVSLFNLLKTQMGLFPAQKDVKADCPGMLLQC